MKTRAKSEAHHFDYAKPLEVLWICRRHHFGIHHPLSVAGDEYQRWAQLKAIAAEDGDNAEAARSDLEREFPNTDSTP
jgi:hypothetical protein